MLPKKARLPKPFQRPAVEVGGGHNKRWQEIPASKLMSGDLIASFGLVTDIYSILADDELVQVRVENSISNEVTAFAPDDVLKVFGPPRPIG